MKRNFKKLLACVTLAYSSVVLADVTNERGINTGGAVPRIRPHFGLNNFGGSGRSTIEAERADNDQSMGGTFCAAATYEMTFNKTSRGSEILGKKLGIAGNNTILVKSAPTETNAVDVRDFINYTGTVAANDTKYASASITFNPEYKRFIVDLAYNHDLSSFYEGLFVGVALPIVYQKNELKIDYKDEVSGVAGTASTINDVKTVRQFFEGTGDAGNATTGQVGLSHGTFKNADAKINLQNLPAWLGLRVVDGENFKANLAGTVHIPTSSTELDCKTIFEPKVVESNLKLGAKLCMEMCLVDGADYKASLDLLGQWLYAWSRTGRRLPASTDGDYNVYKLVVQEDSTAAPTPLMNLLLNDQNVSIKVKPQHSLLGAACLSFEKGCMVADLRYNITYLSDESNDVTNNIAGKKTYYIYNKTANTYSTTAAAAKTAGNTTVDFTKFNYNYASLCNHYFGLSLGCVFKEMQYPANLGINVGYEFGGSKNRTCDSISFGAKGSVSF